jgi:hypothetical protein
MGPPGRSALSLSRTSSVTSSTTPDGRRCGVPHPRGTASITVRLSPKPVADVAVALISGVVASWPQCRSVACGGAAGPSRRPALTCRRGARPRPAAEPRGPASREYRGRVEPLDAVAAPGAGRTAAVAIGGLRWAPPAGQGARPRSAGEPAGPAPRSTPRPSRGARLPPESRACRSLR